MADLSSARVMLFTPGNRPERFEKAKELDADGVVIDLEDAISLAEKDKARDIVVQYFKESKSIPHFLRCLRINSLKTPAGLKDILAIIDNHLLPDVLIIPKTEYDSEIIILDALLKPRAIPYIALIETAIGLHNADAIACSSPNLKGVCFGGGDLAADLGATLTWEPMLNARSQIVRAAAMKGLAAFDVPYLNLHDADDTEILNETSKVKAMGFTGKFAIHPKHIKPILSVFTPSPEEVARAQKIVDAYENAKGNACEIDGKMIDVPIVRSAKRILSIAKQGEIHDAVNAYIKIAENRYRENVGLSFEEFQVGQKFHHRPGVTISQQDNKDEALDTINNAQLHYDAHYAEQTEWNHCLGVSTMTLQKLMGITWKTFGRRKRIIAYDDIAMTHPVFAGDTLYAESEIVGKSECVDDNTVSILKVVTCGINQKGDVVSKIQYQMLIYKKAKHLLDGTYQQDAFDLSLEKFSLYRQLPDKTYMEEVGIYYEELEIGETYEHRPAKTFAAEENKNLFFICLEILAMC